MTYLLLFSWSSLRTALCAAVKYVLMSSKESSSRSAAALDSSRVSVISVRRPHSCFSLTGFREWGGKELNSRARNHCSTTGCLNTDLSTASRIWRVEEQQCEVSPYWAAISFIFLQVICLLPHNNVCETTPDEDQGYLLVILSRYVVCVEKEVCLGLLFSLRGLCFWAQQLQDERVQHGHQTAQHLCCCLFGDLQVNTVTMAEEVFPKVFVSWINLT